MSEHSPRVARVRAFYDAYVANDPDAVRPHLTEDFTFSAPPDPLLDIEGFFERCWPDEAWVRSFDLVRTVEHGDEVIVTYEAHRLEGSPFRNTEVFTLRGDQVARVEVYFGWEPS